MKSGRSFFLSRQDVDNAIRERALAVAKSRGLVPENADALDFHSRVAVHYNIVPVAGADGVAVPTVGDVTLTVED